MGRTHSVIIAVICLWPLWLQYRGKRDCSSALLLLPGGNRRHRPLEIKVEGAKRVIVYDECSLFRDRADAGERLAQELDRYKSEKVVVLAIPSGGVPVAVKVAERLDAELDIVVVRKIAIPYIPEAGYGAVTEDGTVVLNEPLVAQLQLINHEIQRQAEEVKVEVARRSSVFRKMLPISPLDGKTAIIIDDGLASGFTMVAAIKSVRQRDVAKVVVAVPVASAEAYNLVKPLADDLVSLIVARINGFAVADFYHKWYDLTDDQVIKCLEGWLARRAADKSYESKGNLSKTG